MTPVFDRVLVDFLTLGGARVQWEINPHFREPEPWTFQLQVAETDLPDGNWTNVGASVVNTFFVTDASRRAYGKEFEVFYRIKLTSGIANEYFSPAADVMGKLSFKQWHLAQEIVRKEDLRLRRLGVGVEGVILKAKQSGTPCPVCLDPYTDEVTDSKCPICYGTRWTGGYYPPFPAVFADVSGEQSIYFRRESQPSGEGGGPGMANPQIIKGWFVAAPWLRTRDIWINRAADVRYQVHEVAVGAQLAGVPLTTNVGLRPLPPDDVVYTVPL